MLALWRYLVMGSDDLILSRDWLADRDRLAVYEAWTRDQLNQGSVVADTAAMRRRAFWRAVDAKQAGTREKVTSIRRMA